MQATLAELAAMVGGDVAGPGELVVYGAAPLGDVVGGQITLVDRQEKGRALAASEAAAVVCPRSFQFQAMPAICVDDVHRAFAAIITFFRPERRQGRIGVSRRAVVSPTARLGENVDVHPLATLGDDVTVGAGSTIHSGVHVMAGSRIAEDVTIFPNAVLYENTVVGPRCLIHAGAVLGAYGFGYEQVEGRHRLTAQLGNVVLGADVEIGAGSTIDRGTYGPTVIADGTKIDDLVMVAHNCHVGRHNMLCSQVGIAGSTSTGDYVVMAGQVGVRDHVRIGRGAVVGAKAGVINDIPDGARFMGIPATPERDQKLKQAAFTRLPEMRRQIKQLQRTVDALISRIAELEQSHGNGDRRAVA
ncbi:MAG: UDP-3-O-(3-hydroxymyristoyl)glucosamine N-acyltransferase [Thermoguttaceae bacterium]|jgi:UDP-3-O-[3-hydroxymyristoyl] glucosamine N-acyltransferase